MKKIIIGAFAATLLSVSIIGFVWAENMQPQSSTANQENTLSCVATAIAKREAAIQSAFSTFSSAYSSALTTRASELATAWSMTDRAARLTAIKAAWQKFSTSQRTAKKTYNDARKAAWNQFSGERKACKAPATGENPGADTL